MGNKSNRNILLLVEGESSEVKLFTRISECFPQLGLEQQNILVYRTTLWVLIKELKKDFGGDWYEQEIDFRKYLRSCARVKSQVANIDTAKITDIYLIFDFERHAPQFDPQDIENMQSFFNESTDNGKLYINYPMIESYKHLNKKPLPDPDYLERKCECSKLFSSKNHNNEYKEIVGVQSRFTDLRKLEADDFKQLVIHNLCKAARITRGSDDISEETAHNYWINYDMLSILTKQISCSQDKATGFVYVLCTCLFVIPDYNSRLIF